MRLFFISLFATILSNGCKSRLEGPTTVQETKADINMSFCHQIDYGTRFYNSFLDPTVSKQLTYSYSKDYQQVSRQLSKIWVTKCKSIKNQEQGSKLIDELFERCSEIAQNYDATYQFKDIWFQSRRDEALSTMRNEIKEVCVVAKDRSMIQLKRLPLVYEKDQ